jgi:20S proteasome alpha/beta subunit
MAIGSRSQTSRTYLEKEYENFNQSSKDDLIKHALKALSSSLAGDVELDSKNASISVIGENHNFELIEGNNNTYDALMMMLMINHVIMIMMIGEDVDEDDNDHE